jgi:hypothetical protein
MPRSDLPTQVHNMPLGPEELVASIRTLAGERCLLTLCRPSVEEPLKRGPGGKLIIPEGMPTLLELRGWLHVEGTSQLLITIGARELPDPWATDLVAGTFMLAIDDLQTASLSSFDGHFRVDVRMDDVTVALRDEDS